MNNIEYAIEQLSKVNNPVGYAQQCLKQMSAHNPEILNALKSPEEYVRKQCASKGIDADELLKIVSDRIKM